MVSVCMATYQGETYLKEQIESILCQIGTNDELIISDDGSTDETLEIINSYKDSRVKLYANTGKHGCSGNFENALNKAAGDIIFLADQDDIWNKDKVLITLEYLKNYDFVVSDCVTVDEDMNILSNSRIKEFNLKTGFWRHFIKARYLGCCMAFRRTVLESSLPFPSNPLLVEHDIWIAAIAEAYYRVKIIPQPLISYRRHSSNVSDGGFEKGYPLGNKIIRRLYRLGCVISRFPMLTRNR